MGFTYTRAMINGEPFDGAQVVIQDPRAHEYDVALLYSVALKNAASRILINSLYSMDGAPRFGWHWTRTTAFATEGANAFRSPTDRFQHGYGKTNSQCLCARNGA